MHKLIAIRKQSRLDDVTLAEASVEEKRSQLVERAQNSETAEELVEVGFRQIDPPSVKNDQYTPLPETEPSFSRLGHLGVYIVNAPSQEWETKAQSRLESDYEFLENIALALPLQTGTKEMKETPQPRQHSPWLSLPASGIQAAREKGVSGYGVIVGVLDTGCDADHDEFKDKTIDFLYVNPADPNRSQHNRSGFDSDGHGTHVCSIIAGKDFGIARDVDLMVAAVVTEGNYQSTLERVLFGLNWILTRFNDPENLNKPMIINLSLGVPVSEMTQRYQALDRRLRNVFQRLIADYEVLPVVAIGNDARVGEGAIRAPGYYRSTLSVGAVDAKLKPTDFSSYGLSPDSGTMQPDLVGYGLNIYAGVARNKNRRSLYVTKSGTSMAAPYVSGIAALYASEHSELRGERLRDHLLATALRIEAEAERVGAGLARYVEKDVTEKASK